MPINPKGTVFSSGYNSPISNLNESIKSQWLLGGATLWRRDILEKTQVEKKSMNWAIGEDLIFSYPLSKKETFKTYSLDRQTSLEA